MDKEIIILGNGQIWDVNGIDCENPDKTFEDLFSGRALGELALTQSIFKRYREKNKITGRSVTKALLSKDRKSRAAAVALLEKIGNNAGRGIELLTKGKAQKSTKWSKKAGNYWRNLDGVIIGGGVSSGETGKVIIKYIREYLKSRKLGSIKIFQAKFPGKESGFLGSIAYIFDFICKEGIKSRKNNKIVGLGIDVGRSKIGIGAVVINPKTKKVVSKRKNDIWAFQRSINFPEKSKLKIFKDSDRKYTIREKETGLQLRDKILDEMADLCCWAIDKIKSLNMVPAYNIGIGLPGEATKDGFLVGSTHYLPFFRKKDNFHFSKTLKNKLKDRGYRNYSVSIINDGIASGLANLKFGIGLSNLKDGKYAFLGPGSGLGGFVGQIRTRLTERKRS